MATATSCDVTCKYFSVVARDECPRRYQGQPSYPVLLLLTTGPIRAKSLEQRVMAAILQAKLLPQDVSRFLTVAVSDQKTLAGRSVLDPVWCPVPEGGPLKRFTELPPPEHISRGMVFSA